MAIATQVVPTEVVPVATEIGGVCVSTGPTLKVGFDAFGSYLPVSTLQGLCDPAYKIELVPFYFEGENEFDEVTRAQMLASGELDVLFSTRDFVPKNKDVIAGTVMITPIDQSAGADKVMAWPVGMASCSGKQIELFNDLASCTATYSEGSVGHYQLLALLQIANLRPEDLTLLPQPDVASAVDAGLSGEADTTAAWEPDVLALGEAGARELVSSAWWRNIADDIFVSGLANTEKETAVLEFLRDWFMTVKQQQEDLASLAAAIATWEYNDQATNDWSYVYEESSHDDMVLWMESIAPASLTDARILMVDNPNYIADQMMGACGVWAWGGVIESCEGFDPYQFIESKYVAALANDPSLQPTTGSFVNNSYQPLPQSLPTEADSDVLITLPTVAEFGCQDFTFAGGADTIDPESPEGQALAECAEALRFFVQASDTQILLTCSAAWPPRYNETEIRNFARRRCTSVQRVLERIGIPADRIASNPVVPQDPTHQQTDNESLRVLDRWVKVEVKRPEF